MVRWQVRVRVCLIAHTGASEGDKAHLLGAAAIGLQLRHEPRQVGGRSKFKIQHNTMITDHQETEPSWRPRSLV